MGSLAQLTVPILSPLQMKELQLVLSEANESLRGLQEQLSQERQLRKDEVDNFSQKICQVSCSSPDPWDMGVPVPMAVPPPAPG